jgi:hypothetical protein
LTLAASVINELSKTNVPVPVFVRFVPDAAASSSALTPEATLTVDGPPQAHGVGSVTAVVPANTYPFDCTSMLPERFPENETVPPVPPKTAVSPLAKVP